MLKKGKLTQQPRHKYFTSKYSTQPILVDLQKGVCMKVDSVKTCFSPLRMMCAPHVLPYVSHVFSTLCSQETLVNGQTLFTADHALFISVAHGPMGSVSVVRATAWALMFPPWWVLTWFTGFCERQRERGGDRVRQCVHKETANFENVKRFSHTETNLFFFFSI